MKAKMLYEADGARTWALVFDKGDEVISVLGTFAREHELTAARFTGIGAFREATLGYFDRDEKRYEEIPIREQVELLSLLGDVAEKEGEPAVHAHAVVGLRDGRTRGGHLLAATVWPTLELVLDESPAHLRKRSDEETGLALIDPAV